MLVDLPDEHVLSVRRRLALPALDGAHGTPYLVLHEPVTEDAEGDVEACSPCRPDRPGAVRGPGGYHLLQLIERSNEGPQSVTEYQARHSWAAGDLALWDNRCLLHFAVHDHADAPRLIHRLQVAGPVPT